MHSCCLISGIPQGDRSPRGPSEYDKHPAFKLRKASQAYDKRLAIHLAYLDQRCQEVTARMAHSMKMTSLALKRIRGKGEPNGIREMIPRCKSKSRFKLKPISDKGQDGDKTITRTYDGHFGLNQSSPRRDKSRKMESSLMPKRSSMLPKIKDNKYENEDCTHLKSKQNQCSFGAKGDNEVCSHFPCQQPKTYHSLGFRLDDSSTQQWITWADFKKTKLNLPNYNTTPNLRNQFADEQSSELRRWCSLPMDFESRKQRLKEEIEKRRLKNMANKPKSWETNYGKMTPYKVLAYPVRLHPLQMTTK